MQNIAGLAYLETIFESLLYVAVYYEVLYKNLEKLPTLKCLFQF